MNPEHLDAVTHGENNRRANGFSGRNWRKTECPQGHPYDAENTMYVKSRKGDRPWRQCRICKRHSDRRQYEKKRARRCQ